MSTKETLKRVTGMGLASKLTIMGPYMMAAGTRIRGMEQQRPDISMAAFTRADMHMTEKMALALNGVLMEGTVNALIRMAKRMVSVFYSLKKLQQTQFIQKCKIMFEKDYSLFIHQMVSNGAHFQIIIFMALRFCKRIK